MILPESISGPEFKDGDIVSFAFEDAELTMRLPVIPDDPDEHNIVSSQTDFRNVDTADWTHFGDEGNCSEEIVVQSWNYTDYDGSHNRLFVALSFLKICILKNSQAETDSLLNLNSETFTTYYTQLLNTPEKNELEDRLDWPSLSNNYFSKAVKKEFLDGLQAQLDLGWDEGFPTLTAFFPLNKQFSLRIAFDFGSYHYAGESAPKNPYSDEFWRALGLELFDDLLSYVHIEYAPEARAMIKTLAEKQTAL